MGQALGAGGGGHKTPPGALGDKCFLRKRKVCIMCLGWALGKNQAERRPLDVQRTHNNTFLSSPTASLGHASPGSGLVLPLGDLISLGGVLLSPPPQKKAGTASPWVCTPTHSWFGFLLLLHSVFCFAVSLLSLHFVMYTHPYILFPSTNTATTDASLYRRRRGPHCAFPLLPKKGISFRTIVTIICASLSSVSFPFSLCFLPSLS